MQWIACETEIRAVLMRLPRPVPKTGPRSSKTMSHACACVARSVLQQLVFTLYGATSRHLFRAGRLPKSILIPRRPTFMLGAAKLTLHCNAASLDAQIQPLFCISFIDAQTQRQFGGYQYVAAGSRYETAGCKRPEPKGWLRPSGSFETWCIFRIV